MPYSSSMEFVFKYVLFWTDNLDMQYWTIDLQLIQFFLQNDQLLLARSQGLS